jgi:signal peptidase II
MLKHFKIPLITVFLVLLADQAIKIYIKLNYPLGEVARVADWFIIHFTENPGMAFGFEFGGELGKFTLSLFRILACAGGIYYITQIVKRKEHPGFIFSVSLILAGALGNILDSAFYGMIFDKGTALNTDFQEYLPYSGISNFSTEGYASAMQGCVVDMFYFPMFNGTFPEWFPIWGGEDFQFFRPIFNLADAAISTGVGVIIIFQKKFMKQEESPKVSEPEITAPVENNNHNQN